MTLRALQISMQSHDRVMDSTYPILYSSLRDLNSMFLPESPRNTSVSPATLRPDLHGFSVELEPYIGWQNRQSYSLS